jgi:hypothetical protein
VGVQEALETLEKLREAAEPHHERAREDHHESFTRRAAGVLFLLNGVGAAFQLPQ